MRQRFLQSGEEPGIVLTEHVAQQHPQRLRAFGGEIGHVGRDQFPGDVGGVLAGEEVHALGHGVMGQHQRFAADSRTAQSSSSPRAAG